VTVVLFAFYPIWYPYTPAGMQRREMDRAKAVVPELMAKIGNDPRFTEVKAGPYTGSGGGLLIYGYVRTEEDLAAIESIAVPFRLRSNVRIEVRVDPRMFKISEEFRLRQAGTMPTSQP
jgi:hypothetical protein